MIKPPQKWLYVLGFPKSGTGWLVRLLADALESRAYSGQKKHPSFKQFENNNGEYLISHLHVLPGTNTETADCKIVYIVRDFRDIIVSSFFHHYQIDENLIVLNKYSSDKSLKRIFWRKIAFNLETYKIIRCWGGISGGDSMLSFIYNFARLKWLKEIFYGTDVGSWSNHVEFWSHDRPNLTVIKYEDLLTETLKTIVNLLSELEVQFSVENVENAIERQSFNKTLNLFRNHDETISYTRFLRKGTSGDWERFLNTNMVKSVKYFHGRMMNKFGYKI